MSKKSWAVGMMIPFAAATIVASAPAASAKTVAAQASGRCSSGSHWTMKAKPDNGRMELETPNMAGVDHFVGVARNTRTAEVCVARVNR